MTENQQEKIHDFLKQAGWGSASIVALNTDWSQKHFFRLTRADSVSAILVDWCGWCDPLSKTYSVMSCLRESGISAPQIYAVDLDLDLILMEDFGSVDFQQALTNGQDFRTVYERATQIAKSLRNDVDPQCCDISSYFGSRWHGGKTMLMTEYLQAPDDQVIEYEQLWLEIEKNAPAPPTCFAHGDFHLNNLMWCDDHTYGLIDFDAAHHAPWPYDLVGLLEDIRRDVPEDIKISMRDHYCYDMTGDALEIFDLWYDILAFQFHAKILGQIALLKRPDLDLHAPRVKQHIHKHLQNPLFEDFKSLLKI